MPRWRNSSPYLLSALLIGAGTLHFVFPAAYESIIPPALPAPRLLVYISGLAEIACGLALLDVRLRRLGGLASAVLFVAIFPANVQMALDAEGSARALAVARLPLQALLVLWALDVRSQVRRSVPPPV